MSVLEPTITNSRELTVERLSGSVEWSVLEFDGSNRMLIARGAGTQFHAHFTAEQWAEFQRLIAGQS